MHVAIATCTLHNHIVAGYCKQTCLVTCAVPYEAAVASHRPISIPYPSALPSSLLHFFRRFPAGGAEDGVGDGGGFGATRLRMLSQAPWSSSGAEPENRCGPWRSGLRRRHKYFTMYRRRVRRHGKVHNLRRHRAVQVAVDDTQDSLQTLRRKD
jgi:hypothetical protein